EAHISPRARLSRAARASAARSHRRKRAVSLPHSGPPHDVHSFPTRRSSDLLGFVKFGDRDWTPAELNALKAIASLFAQVQARIDAEGQLRYLAEHDDLTGLFNRRALLARLDTRLQPGQPGPVAVLFFDLDRLKAINDYLGHTAGDWFIRTL